MALGFCLVTVDKWKCVNWADFVLFSALHDLLHETGPWWLWYYFHGTAYHPQKIHFHGSHHGSRCILGRQIQASGTNIYVCPAFCVSWCSPNTCIYSFLDPWHWCTSFDVGGWGITLNASHGAKNVGVEVCIVKNKLHKSLSWCTVRIQWVREKAIFVWDCFSVALKIPSYAADWWAL